MERYNGTTIQQDLTWLEKTQWWSPNQIIDLQNKKLQTLIKHSYENVPYYHQLFRENALHPDDIRTIQDLTKIPLLSKDTFKKMSTELHSKVLLKNTVPASSGGSTGEPVQFLRSKREYSYAWAAAFRGWRWAGYNLGDRYVTLWGNPVGVSQQKKLIKRIKNSLVQNISLSAYNITEGQLKEYTDTLQKFQPKIIRGYSQAIYLLAKYIEKNNIEGIRPDAVLTTAETLFSHQRKIIEQQFGCRVFDGYGGGEAPSAAYECEEHHGYHISSENFIIEIIKNGEAVSPGESGKIVITNLNNTIMPFLRYEMGDVGAFSDETCTCGRGLPLLKTIEGRMNDIIVTPEGKFVHSYLFSAIFKDYTSIHQFQVIQNETDSISIRVVKNDQFTDTDFNHIISSIQQVLGNRMKIHIEFVDEIPVLSGSGKRRFVISTVPLKF
jgi:phenylacetate-CoA ligase